MKNTLHIGAKLILTVVISTTAVFHSSSGASAPASTYPPVSTPNIQTVPARTSTPSHSSAKPEQVTTTVLASTGTENIRGNKLAIQSIGLIAPIVSVGVTTDNAIDVPTGRQVGMWNGASVPGSPGAVFLDGHVDGVFSRLASTRIGDVITLSYDSRSYSYQIVHTETVALAGIDMNRALSVYGNNALEGLTIMTCAGTYMPSVGTYSHRFVVYAHLISQ